MNTPEDQQQPKHKVEDIYRFDFRHMLISPGAIAIVGAMAFLTISKQTHAEPSTQYPDALPRISITRLHIAQLVIPEETYLRTTPQRIEAAGASNSLGETNVLTSLSLVGQPAFLARGGDGTWVGIKDPLLGPATGIDIRPDFDGIVWMNLDHVLTQPPVEP